MRFEWDEAKNRLNKINHQLSFETASEVFDDPRHRSIPDRVVEGEQRWQTIGLVGGVVPILVAHTYREDDARRSCGSFQLEKRRERSAESMRKSRSRTAELRRLSAMPDSEIDTSEIPEIKSFKGAVVGKFYRPLKQQVTLRLDADVLAWFKAQGGRYQTEVNRALREHMLKKRRPAARKAG